MYLPAVGAPAVYRSAGPVASDVRSNLEKLGPNDIPDPKTLGTKALGYAAAEESTLKHLEHIRAQKEKAMNSKSKPKAAAKINTPMTRKSHRVDKPAEEMEMPGASQSAAVKRENPKTPEEQEVEVIPDDNKSWVNISP